MKSQISQLRAYTPGLSPEALKKKLGITGELHKLASNENVYGPSPKAKEAIKSHVDDLFLYPEPNAPLLQEVIATHYGVDQDQVVFGAGLDEMIVIISRTTIRSGDKVVTSEGTFGQYFHNAVVEDANIVQVPLQDGTFDLDGIAEAVDDETALVWICNPNNPTGTYHNADAIEAFIQKIPSHVTILFDEAYAEYVTADDYPDTIELMKKYDNIAMLRTFSKAYGLAGLRIGYMIAPMSLAEQLNVIRPPFNTTRLSEQAALAAFKDQTYLEKTVALNKEEREKFENIDTTLKLYPTQTNFIFVETDRVAELDEALLKAGIIARAFPNGVRITFGFPEQNTAIREVLSQF
ncbi:MULTISPECIES: histidinol-phosphate transaminase [unclassified Staphylococcus]|uniref:histidinol-phosphate transaminase n=1 Tax=unclassified Staphylococcus TaxID=91994 RepID=UPI0021D0DBAF|nr:MULTISPECIES: histidinol-phosphate transaminase [unclassified Staphylococcus]UXR69973.1 histidinol-phosphate transaminase [Staphylococcus sp. IVB6246]UXR72015.1 histidinol-phosphate transaminase [Staphylococcus sp. IVB6240]UXR74322.1 histidinol-phosphate transaminase [Staphylococcus sp. IVB6238]UXR76708.1 histidinol-phosphate transaminase [Staphylococcus sp. IVB6233]UXR80837.1 histidinol-phosphate transaminase [Staphylococcus sp. IVB6218]